MGDVKARCRFGIRLSWPIANAATFVIYLKPDVWQKLFDAVGLVRTALTVGGAVEIADRMICERS